MFGTFIKTRSTKAEWEDGYSGDDEGLIKEEWDLKYRRLE
jgi:hypothetical protein